MPIGSVFLAGALLNMESDMQHFRHILLFYYRKGKNVVLARKKLTNVYGDGVLIVRQCRNWFTKFRFCNFDVEDAPRSGRPVETDKDAIKALVDENRRITPNYYPVSTPDQRVEAAWYAIPQKHIHSLFRSMPRRVAAVISNNDSYSGY
ncbi:histone-lysine N-methyltransferase SETMAR [Trichonephila clavipes]|nr:histone-lysine N-methyltransferase SETMAR [Trichonephila clavipes]